MIDILGRMKPNWLQWILKWALIIPVVKTSN